MSIFAGNWKCTHRLLGSGEPFYGDFGGVSQAWACTPSILTFLSSILTFLSSKLTFLSSILTFGSSKLTFLSSGGHPFDIGCLYL